MKVLLTWLFMLMFEFNIQPFLLEERKVFIEMILVHVLSLSFQEHVHLDL